MQAYDRLRQLADDWQKLHPNHELEPRQREELAQRTAECLAYFTDTQAQSDPTVVDLALTRAIRLCERLARAIQSGAPLSEPPPSSAAPSGIAPEPSQKAAASGPIVVDIVFGVGATVEIRGRVGRRDLANALRELDRMLSLADGALLVDAQSIEGYAPECARVLSDWVALRGAMRVKRIAVVVAQRTQFVRASRALASATGIAWLIAHDRLAAERWLAAARTTP